MSALLRSALGVVCPSCDAYNPPQATTCQGCALALGPRRHDPAPPRRTSSSIATAAAALSSEDDDVFHAPSTASLLTPVPPGMRPAPRTPPAPAARTPTPAPIAAAPAPPAATPLTPPRGAAATARPAAGPRYGLTVVQGKARGARFRLPAVGVTIGTQRTALVLDDPFVSTHHATLLVRDGVLHLRDEGSTSGSFVSIAGQEVLPPGTCFAVGPRLFRYGGTVVPPIPVSGRPLTYGAPVPSGQSLYLLEELLAGGRPGRAIAATGPLITVGYGPCDFSVPQEEGLAQRHCELSPGPASALLRDLSGGLGTYVRLAARSERPVRVGDRLRLGGHVLQVEPPI